MITLQLIRKLNACEEQVELFQTTFGEQVAITRANFDIAIEVGLNVKWFILKFSDSFYKQYETLRNSAWESYKEVEYKAYLVYREGVERLQSEIMVTDYITEERFNSQVSLLLEQYNAIESSAYGKYNIEKNNFMFSTLEQIFGKD